MSDNDFWKVYADKQDRVVQDQANRIEALEAALRGIADDPTGNCMVCVEIARAALALERNG